MTELIPQNGWFSFVDSPTDEKPLIYLPDGVDQIKRGIVVHNGDDRTGIEHALGNIFGVDNISGIQTIAMCPRLVSGSVFYYLNSAHVIDLADLKLIRIDNVIAIEAEHEQPE